MLICIAASLPPFPFVQFSSQNDRHFPRDLITAANDLITAANVIHVRRKIRLRHPLRDGAWHPRSVPKIITENSQGPMTSREQTQIKLTLNIRASHGKRKALNAFVTKSFVGTTIERPDAK